ncbi:MAG: YeiH family putative sulfate export transporter [Parasporobacterium sp.]|nr:YeiH family putative sulfate export transporter [Parasporobacterium sp.]
MTKLKTFFKKSWKGILLCLAVAVPCWFLGKLVPVVGGAVFAIVIGMILGIILKDKTAFADGIKFTSKKVLQWAVILLGFGMNLNVILETGAQSLPIILCTIAISLIVAFVLHFVLKIPGNISTLIGVGSSICGGSAIAATAPVIDADDEEVAQAISVIFFFNVIAAIVFPYLGQLLGFATTSGEAFGIFAGTAVNDTSSVTAAASTWDAMWGLGSATLDKAVTVKLTRTLAIIPITLVLAFVQAGKAKKANNGQATKNNFSFKKIFPWFILYFIAAAVITTVALKLGAPAGIFSPFKELSKFFIVLAMAAIGINTDIVKLVKTGGKPLIMGACCWISITGVSLLMQHLMKLW